jgi:urocanate hydratase
LIVDTFRVTCVADTLDQCVDLIKQYRRDPKPISIGFYGNIVDLWEKLAEEHKKSVAEGLVVIGRSLFCLSSLL